MTGGLTVVPAGALARVFEGVALPTSPLQGGLLAWAMCRTAAPTLTARQASPLSIDGAANLRIGAGLGANATIPVAPTAPAAGTYTLAAISFAAAGDNTVIAAVAGQTIRIYHYNFVLAAASNITLKSGAVAKSGVYPLQQYMGLVFDAPGGAVTFDCAASAAFVINNSNAIQVSGFVLYTQS